jgi:hypothetical protein
MLSFRVYFIIYSLTLTIMCIPLRGQAQAECKIIIIARVLEIDDNPAYSGPSGGVYTAYRPVKYSVVEVLKGNLAKKEINVAHIIVDSIDGVERLRIGNKVLLCLMRSNKKNDPHVVQRNTDFTGTLLLTDCGCNNKT